MGKIIDSLRREVGKNTGKWVSNKVFGDGHSTPHRTSVRIEQQKLKNKLKKEEIKAEKKAREYEKENNIDAELQNLRTENIKKREVIIEMNIPNEKNEILNLVNLLETTVNSYGWKIENENEKNNTVSDACLSKLNQCEFKLRSLNNSFEAEYTQQIIKKLKKKKFIQKYSLLIAIALLIGGIYLYLFLFKK